MTITTRFNWLEQLLAPLDEAKISHAIADENSDWEYIDGEMVKFGSLTHGALNIEALQHRCLQLFATETKDFRLFVHLIRTLQHAGDVSELVLAADLATHYMQHYWLVSHPTNMRLKQRLAQQIIKRFESAQASFCRHANCAQRDDILGSFAYLAQFWHQDSPALSTQIDALSRGYSRLENSEQPTITVAENQPIASTPISEKPTATQVITSPDITPSPRIEVNHSDYRQWKQTLLKVAGLLCEQHPAQDIGYRLRRHAIWSAIQTPPMSDEKGKTPLAAVAIDRITDYCTQLAQPTLSLLNEIEQSLTLSPYWLDGHCLAAKTAQLLGFESISQAIAQELTAFLTRLPQLNTLYFADLTPFISPDTQHWLAQSSNSAYCGQQQAQHTENNHQEIMTCFEQQGLNAALLMIENALTTTINPRDSFYLQLLCAQLFEACDMKTMATYTFQQLHQQATSLSLSQWEPDLFTQLTSKLESKNNAFNRK